MTGIVATAEIDIAAGKDRVWETLTDPDLIQKYMFGSKVETDWKPGSDIRWKGEYDGKPYEDKGTVVKVEEGHELVVTHYSPMSGQKDEPENYHQLVYHLHGDDTSTHLSLSQDNNGSEEEAEHSRENWATMLTGLKDVAEG